MVTAGKYKIVKIAGGPITVAYRKEDDLWYCTALQFDIMGNGKTREKAFAQLKKLVNSYLIHVLSVKGPVSFFNPSDREEWETDDKRSYDVLVLISGSAPVSDNELLKLSDVKLFSRRVKEFELAPTAC